VGLVTQPSILLLDEPTSGLDSHAAATVIEALQNIAHNKGLSVIATIHQPSQRVFEMFDTLVLLVSGSVVYWGPRQDAAKYLNQTLGMDIPTTVATPDFILDVISDKSGSKGLAEAWQQHSKVNDNSQYMTDALDVDSSTNSDQYKRHMPSLFFQLLVQLQRQCMRLSRTLMTSLVVSCLVFAFSGMYLGLAFTEPKYVLPVPKSITQWCPRAITDLTDGNVCNDSWPSQEVQGLAAMYFCMGLGTVATAFSVWTFGGTRIIYWRETRNGISPLCYYLAANAIDAFKCALFALFFTSTYFLIAAPYGAFSEYYSLCFGFILVNYGIGYLVSSFLEPSNAAFVASILALVSGVFSGFVFQFSPLWPWYFGEGIFRSEVQYIVQHATKEEMHWVRKYADEMYGYNVEDNTILEDNFILLAFAAAFRVVAYFTMRLCNRSQQT